VRTDVNRALDTVPVLVAPREVEPLRGGLTNQSYVVTTRFGQFVARFSATPSAALLIDREAEARNCQLAAECGAGPRVVAYRPGVDLLVTAWLEGRTLASANLAIPDVLDRVITAVHRLHRAPRFAGNFDIFSIQRRYLVVVLDRGFRLPAGYLEYMPRVADIDTALAVRSQPKVPCHNDLVASNLIDDGERVWIVDYEYAGNNDPAFELGSMWGQAGLPVAWLDDAVIRYYGALRHDLIARVRLYGLMANYSWTLWASIQHSVSDIAADFWSGATEMYDRAVAEFDGPDFARLLAAAAR
jgi:thiamine kinase-like enzyme